jgi:hypothetical protein
MQLRRCKELHTEQGFRDLDGCFTSEGILKVWTALFEVIVRSDVAFTGTRKCVTDFTRKTCLFLFFLLTTKINSVQEFILNCVVSLIQNHSQDSSVAEITVCGLDDRVRFQTGLCVRHYLASCLLDMG